MPKGNHVVGPAASNGASGHATSPRNLVLRSIPRNEYEILHPHLESVPLEFHQVLHQSHQPIAFGYFPDGGVVSLIVPMRDGRSAEVGMVGREGFVGIPLAGGFDRSPHVAMVQIAATAMRIEANALQGIIPGTPRLATLLTRYALIQGMQLAQTAACNRLHNLAQRLARWLLMSQDRSCLSVLPYTHDLLAVMLGTDRPSLSGAIAELEASGNIRHTRGKIEILDREHLKESSCECYPIIQAYDCELEPVLATS